MHIRTEVPEEVIRAKNKETREREGAAYENRQAVARRKHEDHTMLKGYGLKESDLCPQVTKH